MPIKKTLPIVKPFRIASLGWKVSDRRALLGREADRASRLWLDHVRELTSRNDSLRLDDICGVSAVREDRKVRRFHDAQIARPLLDWKSFREEGGGLDREFDIDARLPQLFLCVQDIASTEWLGAIPISNIHIESQDSRTVVANAFFFIGVPSYRGLTTTQTWMAIFEHIFSTPLAMADGRTLEVVQYNMLSSPEQRAVMNDDPDIKELLAAMRLRFDSFGDPQNRNAPVRFRRKARRVRR